MSHARSLRPYGELLRPANVATALADVLAGYGIAGLGNHAALPFLLVATACLYAGGVVLNDVFDSDLDRIERPERPIPSGRVTLRAAAWLGTGLLLAGIISASLVNPTAGLMALAIASAVVLYDAWGKRQGLIGPVNMGLCRGLNLLLGVTAVPAVLAGAWPLALLPITYIAAVTAVSRGDVHGGKTEVAAFALISLSLVLIAWALLSISRASLPGVVWVAILGWRLLPAFWAAYRTPAAGTIRHAIKTGVLSLALLDAVLGAAYAGGLYSLVIVVTALAAGRLARLFPVT
jgi:4-hydroxybenzoate polyprenyltransferase